MDRFYKDEDEKNLFNVINTENLKTLKYHIFSIRH